MPTRERDEVQDELRAVFERLGASGSTRLSLVEQYTLLERTRERMPEASSALDQWMLSQIRELRRGLADAQSQQQKLRELHQKLTSPPWCTGVFLRALAGTPPRAVVVYQNVPRVVTVAENVQVEALSVGDDVLLSHDVNVLLEALTPSVKRMSEVGEFQYRLGTDRLVLKVRDAEMVVHAAATLDLSALVPGDRVLWDPGLAMAFERIVRPADSGLFLTQTPTERFADIGGLDRQIEQLRRAVGLHTLHPELVGRYGLRRTGSVLLVGPPGTGKTMLARALAQWLGEHSRSGRSRFLDVKPGACHSMWFGQSEANYREVFRVARDVAAADPGMPVVMFFDEVDSIGATRSTDTAYRVASSVLESFMAELDGLQSRGNILVVAATNRRDALDPALLRPGRLGDLVLEIPRPSMAAGRAILERCFSSCAPYAADTAGADGRTQVIDAAMSRLYSPNGTGEIASLMFRDGTRRSLQTRDVISGAMLANIARVSTERACVRELETGDAGIRWGDVLDAIADEIATVVATLTPANCHAHVADLPQDLTVVRVTPTISRPLRPHRFMRAVQRAS